MKNFKPVAVPKDQRKVRLRELGDKPVMTIPELTEAVKILLDLLKVRENN